MLLPLGGRRLYYDLAGPENGLVVCIAHSLASDGGSWAEQAPAPPYGRRDRHRQTAPRLPPRHS